MLRITGLVFKIVSLFILIILSRLGAVHRQLKVVDSTVKNEWGCIPTPPPPCLHGINRNKCTQ